MQQTAPITLAWGATYFNGAMMFAAGISNYHHELPLRQHTHRISSIVNFTILPVCFFHDSQLGQATEWQKRAARGNCLGGSGRTELKEAGPGRRHGFIGCWLFFCAAREPLSRCGPWEMQECPPSCSFFLQVPFPFPAAPVRQYGHS